MIKVEIVCDSINENGNRLTTMVLEYPRAIHAQLMTHRVFNRNAASSRAINTRDLISRVEENPVYPIEWGKNKRGMESHEELNETSITVARQAWTNILKLTVKTAHIFADLKLHKQFCNRILEPYAHIQVVLTATEFDNWFFLRDSSHAQPEIKELAQKMKKAMKESKPSLLTEGVWHMPFITHEDIKEYEKLDREEFQKDLCMISAFRCAQVSYFLNRRNNKYTLEEEIGKAQRLLDNLHMSPFEHQGTPYTPSLFQRLKDAYYNRLNWSHSNLVGYCQFRKYLEQKFINHD
ncbi:MAG: FAD-dependent thymidylate synthase [Candidatus Hodarchaeales archaeon]|jgi:hypothetical protein